MELPDDTISLVKEYSMPMTRPDWRTLHCLLNFEFFYHIAAGFNRIKCRSLFTIPLRNQTDFSYMFSYYHGVPFIDFIYDSDIPGSACIDIPRH